MSISLEKLTQILAKSGISSSQEEEILIAAKDVITPPDTNKEELEFEESCRSDEEHMFELEIEREEEGILGDQHPEEYQSIKSCIKQWFQVSVKLDRFLFRFYFINSHFQYLIFHIILYSRFSFSELKDNLGLLLLDRWLHSKFHFM